MAKKEKVIPPEILDANREIVQRIVDEGVIEKIIFKITKGQDPDTQDLVQDLILALMGEKRLVGLSERGELNFYLARIIMNNIASSSSPYYCTYKKFLCSSVPLDDLRI